MTDIHHDLIHRHPSQDGTAQPADEHRGAIPGNLARITVPIARRQRSHQHRFRRNERAAITDPVPRWKLSHERDARLPCQGRAKLVLIFRQRRHAVQHQPRPHQLARRTRIVQNPGTVGDVQMKWPILRLPVLRDRTKHGLLDLCKTLVLV
jgi:hypothetical protein